VVRIVTDSTADIPAELAARLDITMIPSYVVFGTESFRDGVELSQADFYAKLETSLVIPTTAAPPPAVYEEVYRRLLDDCEEILSIHLAGRLSALYSSALQAASAIGGSRIAVVDSEQATMGYGWMAVAAAEAARQGADLEQLVQLVKDMKGRCLVLAALDRLDFLRRGGRVGWAQAMVGTFLRIKPIVEIKRSQVTLVERRRTMRRALVQIVEMVRQVSPLERAAVLHCNVPKLGAQLADQLRAALPDWEPLIVPAGATIASHAGPGAVAVACVRAGT
jgi:DegV family protein with EDD domain